MQVKLIILHLAQREAFNIYYLKIITIMNKIYPFYPVIITWLFLHPN